MAKTKQKTCIQYAMHYLSRYPKTEWEMGLKLLEKWYPEEEIAESMEYLKTNNYLDDKHFADAYIYSEVIKKWKPLQSVKAKLYSKHIREEALEEVIEENESDIAKGMQQWIIKQIDKRKKRGEDPVEIIQKLQRQWYHFNLIKKTIEDRAAWLLD